MRVWTPLLCHLCYVLLAVAQAARVSGKKQECVVSAAEACFHEIFSSFPLCTSSELTFRCQHFMILDECFRKSSIICSPAAIGKIATATHRKQLISCARQSNKQYRNAPNRRKIAPTIVRNHPPTELQFISLFGYLQSQCKAKLVENCTNPEFQQMTSTCESDIRQKSGLANSDYDLHRLLKTKLDVSSQLLQLSEVRRDDECLIVRAALSDIFQIHQKYCFHTVVTRCMCERMNFQYYCDIECATLDSSGLPFDMRVSWSNFKGQLVGAAPATSLSLLPVLLCFIVNRVSQR